VKNIPTGSKVALDSMIFIYLFEEDERFLRPVESIFEKVELGKITAITSVISLIETLSAPKLKDIPEKTQVFSRFFYETPNLTTLEVNKEIALEASRLRREKEFLRTPDSIQIATATNQSADFFVTNDFRLKNLVDINLKIISLQP